MKHKGNDWNRDRWKGFESKGNTQLDLDKVSFRKVTLHSGISRCYMLDSRGFCQGAWWAFLNDTTPKTDQGIPGFSWIILVSPQLLKTLEALDNGSLWPAPPHNDRHLFHQPLPLLLSRCGTPLSGKRTMNLVWLSTGKSDSQQG